MGAGPGGRFSGGKTVTGSGYTKVKGGSGPDGEEAKRGAPGSKGTSALDTEGR